MQQNKDSDNISFNPKTLYTVMGILAVLIGAMFWVTTVRADLTQTQKEVRQQQSELDLLKNQLSEMKIQLTVIQEQNKQLKATLEEVRLDVAVIKKSQ
jgi:peptidoglycan hydrolase CwlO-like protein